MEMAGDGSSGDVTFELKPAMERRKRGASAGVSAGTEALRWK